ncbi:metal ABC transporter solute-binding protein, Zn/Mn family [Bacillus horti]|uniref:Zinc transport system substrate-binding protein n=1 Tax=Caldalkalibacillus horti TaxID=77523 RepID=A0ABT9W4D7_9BACI|nr:zinc ABC transporter substrate-binding protein [Bacillus horti]MDQ0168102.1 zinc transport system substrate-binding protein [Bacillus horti]
MESLRKERRKVMLHRKERGSSRRLSFVLGSMLLIFALIVVGCSTQEQTSEPESSNVGEIEETIKIFTTVYPVHYFAEQIAGSRAEVRSLIPVGVDPHDFEPTARDIMALSDADMFIYNGGGFEGWIERIVESVNNDSLVWVDSTETLTLLTNEETGHIHDDHDHGHHGDAHGTEEDDHDHDHHGDTHGTEEDHDHDHHEDAHGTEEDDHDHDHHHHGEFDPHVWLDPTLAKQQAEAIKNALVELDPEHAEEYEANFEQMVSEFDALDAAFKELVESVNRTDFIVAHAAYGYLSNRYGLNQIAISGLDPSQEPSPRQLQQIIEFAEENEVQYILFENFVSTKVAEVVQEAIGAESLVIYNLEAITEEEQSQGENYFTLMHRNVEVLKIALDY